MAVLESNQTVSNNRNGFDKEISKSARTMMLDNIQNFIYQKPIPSCVRETVSNCIDATNEKLVALKILSGELDVKSVYKTLDDVEVSKDGDNIYQDSEFKADYYDPEWLSESNKIEIKYTCNTVIGEKDTFSITDNGVGIGGARLEGIFSLGFSTKRLNANELGGFGIGQKSALATGVASYRMITRHNGKEFTFDIFSHKVENVNGKWNPNGQLNQYIEFENTLVESGQFKQVMQEDGTFKEEPIMEKFKAFFLPTLEKNGTTIEFEVKSHNKQAFIDAVKSQLMYLKDDITFTMVDMYSRQIDVPFKQRTIYEDENTILSDYGYFNRPHFVIKGIAYGMIDFQEAELAPKFGNIGFKFNMEDLDVLPSREGVRYTPKTSAAIVKLYDKNKATVEAMISKDMDEKRFFPWLQVATKLTNRAGSASSQDVLARLSSLADLSELDLSFNENVKYSSSFKKMFTPIFSLQVISKTYNNTIKRDDSDYTSMMNNSLHIQFGGSSSRTTAFLMVNNPSLTILRTSKAYRYLAPMFIDLMAKKFATDEAFLEACAPLIKENEIEEVKMTEVTKLLVKALEVFKLLIADNLVPVYDEVEVPESFTISEDVKEDEIAEKLEAERYKQILKERKANKEFYIQKIEVRSTWTNDTKLSRVLTKFSDLDAKANAGCKLVYFTEDSDASFIKYLLNFPIKRRSPGNASVTIDTFDNENLLVFKIAKSNVNQVKNIATEISKWFVNVDDDGVLTLEPMIKASINKDLAWSMPSWVTGIAKYNQGINERVRKLAKINDAMGSTSKIQFIVDLVDISNAAAEVDNDYTHATIAPKLAKFITHYKLPETVTKINVIDRKVVTLTEECKDFQKVYGNFLNNIDIDRCKEEVEIVLQAKKDQLKFKFKGLHDDNNS